MTSTRHSGTKVLGRRLATAFNAILRLTGAASVREANAMPVLRGAWCRGERAF